MGRILTCLKMIFFIQKGNRWTRISTSWSGHGDTVSSRPPTSLRQGLYFINILLAAFTHADPESAKKKTVKLSAFFALLGSACAKAAHRTFMKLTQGLHFNNILLKTFLSRSIFCSFFLVTVWHCNFWSVKILMKLIQGLHFNNLFFTSVTKSWTIS